MHESTYKRCRLTVFPDCQQLKAKSLTCSHAIQSFVHRPEEPDFQIQVSNSIDTTTISPKEGSSKGMQHSKYLPCSNHSVRLIFDDLFSFG